MVLYFLSPTVAVQTVMTAATIFRFRMSFFIPAPRIRKITSSESVFWSFIMLDTVIVFTWFFKTTSASLSSEVFTFTKDFTGNKSQVSRRRNRYFWLRIHVYDITLDINKKRRDCRRIALNLADGWENEHLAFENILTEKQPNK